MQLTMAFDWLPCSIALLQSSSTTDWKRNAHGSGKLVRFLVNERVKSRIPEEKKAVVGKEIRISVFFGAKRFADFVDKILKKDLPILAFVLSKSNCVNRKEIFKNTTEQEGKMKKSFSFSFFYPPFMSHFTLRQREMLSEFLSVGKSYRMIGKAIGKSISSISDEIKRNS